VAEVEPARSCGNFLKINSCGCEIVSVGVEVPNPGGGFGTFGEGSRSKWPGLAEHIEIDRKSGSDRPETFAFVHALCGLMVIETFPRGKRESRWGSTPRAQAGKPGRWVLMAFGQNSRPRPMETRETRDTIARTPATTELKSHEGTAGGG